MKNLVIVSLLSILAGMFVQSNKAQSKLRAENQQWREAAARAAIVYTTDGFTATKVTDPQSLANVIERNYRAFEDLQREARAQTPAARMAKN